jgi:enterochelin esterase-like enzyme
MDFVDHKAPILIILCLLLVFLPACSVQTQAPVFISSKTPAATSVPLAVKTAVLPSLTPSPAPSPTNAACTEQTGTIITVSVPSQLEKQPTELKVYTPPCYSVQSSLRYPVLYMLHGQTYDDTQWIDLGLTAKADQMISGGSIPPMIIVLPDEAASMSDANTSKFSDAIIDEVIPWVDANFSTCAARACRAIGGLSRGGNWAIRIGLSHPDQFAVIGAHSAPLFYGDLNRVEGWIAALSPEDPAPMIYIDFGKSDEDLNDMLQFDKKLNHLGVAHQMLEFNGFHDAYYWSTHVEDYLQWYSQSLSEPQTTPAL